MIEGTRAFIQEGEAPTGGRGSYGRARLLPSRTFGRISCVRGSAGASPSRCRPPEVARPMLPSGSRPAQVALPNRSHIVAVGEKP